MDCLLPDFQPIPVFPSWRKIWAENLTNLASSLTLYSNTSLKDALAMTVSTGKIFLESTVFDDWKKTREAEMKVQAAVIDRLNGVIRGCNLVAKMVAKTSR